MHVSLWNVALQTVNFLILAWLLQRFLFKPVRAVLARRQATIDQALHSADAEKNEAQRIVDEYRAKTAGVEAEAQKARQQAVTDAEREATRVREEGEKQARAALERAHAEIEHERAEALRGLEVRAAELATGIAERLLRDVLPESDAPFLWRATASIDALEPARKAALGRQLSEGGAVVVSSRPLDAETRERFERWLSTVASRVVTVAYSIDAGLIAGVELRLGTGVWRSHWRATLERIRAELQAHEAAA